jgi:6-phosphogluconate dehydrogenase
MTDKQPQQRHQIGIVGLGVTGPNLMLNMADPDCSVADYGFEALSVEEK